MNSHVIETNFEMISECKEHSYIVCQTHANINSIPLFYDANELKCMSVNWGIAFDLWICYLESTGRISNAHKMIKINSLQCVHMVMHTFSVLVISNRLENQRNK